MLYKKARQYLHYVKMLLARRGVLLLYHSIADVKVDPWQLHVSPVNFESHLRMLKQYFHPMSLEEFLFYLQRKSLPPKSVVLTFDDGYANNFTHALPLLEKYEVPATFFITTGSVNSEREFWWDELEQLIFLSPVFPIKELSEIAGLSAPLSSREEIYYAIWRAIQSVSEAERMNILQQLNNKTNLSLNLRCTHRPLRLEELKKLAASPYVSIGAHTVSHPDLCILEAEMQFKEIQECKETLEEWLHEKITSFSYPFGSFNDTTISLIEKAHFESACSTIPRCVKNSFSIHTLPRLFIQDWPGRKFKQALIRIFSEA